MLKLNHSRPGEPESDGEIEALLNELANFEAPGKKTAHHGNLAAHFGNDDWQLGPIAMRLTPLAHHPRRMTLVRLRMIPLVRLRMIPLVILRMIPLVRLRKIPLVSLRNIPLVLLMKNQSPKRGACFYID
jgi:hypothetical protein